MHKHYLCNQPLPKVVLTVYIFVFSLSEYLPSYRDKYRYRIEGDWVRTGEQGKGASA